MKKQWSLAINHLTFSLPLISKHPLNPSQRKRYTSFHLPSSLCFWSYCLSSLWVLRFQSPLSAYKLWSLLYSCTHDIQAKTQIHALAILSSGLLLMLPFNDKFLATTTQPFCSLPTCSSTHYYLASSSNTSLKIQLTCTLRMPKPLTSVQFLPY